MNLTTTKDYRFRDWIRENYKINPNTLKPKELHEKFIVYLAWKQAEQPPNNEKLQQYHMDTN
jgi:hypothetical protein